MLTVSTLLDRLITLVHDGNNTAFASRHGISKQEVGNIVNGTGNGTMSYKRLDGYARKEGYTIGIVLHRYTGDMVADALEHAKAAAVEARHVLEYQETLTPEMERWLALLDALIEAG